MELSFIWYLNFLKQFARNERASEVLVPQQIYVLSQSFQVRLIWTFVPQNCTTETEGIYWEKAALNPLESRWSVPFEFSFCEGKTRFAHALAANKRANSHNFKIKKIEFTHNYFPRSVLTMNCRWEWIILSVRSLTVFEEKNVVTVPAKLVPLFFKSSFFFLTRSLIDRFQIVTDTCKNNVSKFVWKPFKSPLSLRKWKCFGEEFFFNLHHLHFNYHLLAQKLFSLRKILPYLQP